MKYLSCALGIAAALVATNAIADYQEGWDSSQFYEQVALCRQAVVYPAAKAYIEKGLKAGTGGDKLRSEVITMLPLFDASANPACFCAVNELAKARKFSEYASLIDTTARVNVLSEYMRKSVCVTRMNDSMKALQKDGAWKSLKLD